MTNRRFWTQKDGTKIRIKDMENTHINNSMKMLERMHHQQQMQVSPPSFQGEMAQYYADQDYNDFMSSTVDERYPIYADLAEELEMRRIKSAILS